MGQPGLLVLSAFAGCGLKLSGVTDTCGMGTCGLGCLGKIRRLNPEQKAAYRMLGKVLSQNAYVPVTALEICGADAASATLAVGEVRALSCDVLPARATRNNVVWESSDPSVVTVNKFGELTAHAAGTAEIVVYSWDDAAPVANGKAPAYRRDGLSDRVTVTVGP